MFRLPRVHQWLTQPGDLSGPPADKDVSETNGRLIFLIWFTLAHPHIKADQRRKEAHQSHTLSLPLFLLGSLFSEKAPLQVGVRLIYPAELPPWLISINHMSACL